MIHKGHRKDSGPDRHGNLRDPKRRCILPLRDIIELDGPENPFIGVVGQVHCQGRANAKTPDLAAAAIAAQLVQQQSDPDMRAVVQSIGQREKRGGGHTITGIIGRADEDAAGPAHDHLRNNNCEQDQQKRGGHEAAEFINDIQNFPNRMLFFSFFDMTDIPSQR